MAIRSLYLCGSALVLSVWQLAPGVYAQEGCDDLAGRFLSVEGMVDVQSDRTGNWAEANLERELCEGDTIRVGNHSRAAVSLINDAVLRMDENTTMRLLDITEQEEERSWLDLISGAFQSFSRKPRHLTVNTPYLNGAIEGTEFVFRVEEGQTQLTVFEGTVVASNEIGSLSVTHGESVVAAAGKAPERRTVVRPRDAAQWSLYYPPILAAGSKAGLSASPALRKAMENSERGDVAGALQTLDQVPAANQDAPYHLYRAGLLLSVGRVNEAKTDIDRALAQDPNAGLAYAQRAVIAVVQNDNPQAIADATQAVALAPESAAAKIALSYAQQANFEIAEARDTLLSAVETESGNPLAWARLSELWLMEGNREQAINSAEKAVALQPDLGRTQITLGFAALSQFQNDRAQSAFQRAVELDSADPLAHLGLGLAKISAGDLKQGRADIEAAVGLGSNNALYRAYLGKAYFEEKRSPLDSEQYEVAKELDPADPTAFLYSGISKQTENRPVEAVRDLEKSIELNDNRAVYRSRLLLDKDRAARGTSLARAYNDLGFKQLGINQSAESLSLDPSNSSAHRFLSDTYLGTRRTEISRVSELLQAQLLQDINVNPVQPSIAATNLNIVTLGGPARPGFNEYTPLFEQNQTQLNFSGFGGENDTYGGEAVVSGLYDRFSFSLGGFSSNTDGWRPNNGLDQNLYDIFAQWAITPELNVQAEYQHRESEEGDLAFNFDPEDFLLDKTVERDRSYSRLGLRYSPTTRSNILLSYVHNDSDELLTQSETLDPFTTLSIDSETNEEGDQFEGQYIYQADQFNVVAGASVADSNWEVVDDLAISDVELGVLDNFGGTFDEEAKHPRGYLYANVPTWGNALYWTIGVSYDNYEEGIFKETSFNPKLGVRWSITDDFLLRAAAFKSVKPLLVNNRTLEPTQVAGFNQFFDDLNGTEAWRYGLGLDWRIRQNLAGGIELTRRDLDEPAFVLFEDPPRVDLEERDEELHRLYLYWTPSDRWGVRGEVRYDNYESEIGVITEFADLPEKVNTVSLPISATYFHPSGFFAGLQGTYVGQEVLRSPNSIRASGEDDFFVADLAVGYRFPKRRGIASLGVKNLFDEEFSYQDDSFREARSEASTGPYFPERMIMGQVTLSF